MDGLSKQPRGGVDGCAKRLVNLAQDYMWLVKRGCVNARPNADLLEFFRKSVAEALGPMTDEGWRGVLDSEWRGKVEELLGDFKTPIPVNGIEKTEKTEKRQTGVPSDDRLRQMPKLKKNRKPTKDKDKTMDGATENTDTRNQTDEHPQEIHPSDKEPVPCEEGKPPTPWRAVRLGLDKFCKFPRARRLRDNAPDGARRFYDVLFASPFLLAFGTGGRFSNKSLLECAYSKMGPKGWDYVIRKGFDCGLDKEEHDGIVDTLKAKRDFYLGKGAV